MRWYGYVLPLCAGLGAMAAPLPAFAQTAVTVSGLLDTGVFHGFEGGTQVGTIQRSNLALSGYEDLDGGMKAVFRFSTRVELDTGSSEGAGYKPFWHDESTVGLKGGWGTIRVGRAMTAMWANDYKFDPWSNYNRIASPAWQHWHYFSPSDPYCNNGTAEYGRINNGIFYDSPTVGGFTLRMSGSPEHAPGAGASGLPYSVVLEYGEGAVAGMAAFERNSVGDKDSFVAAKYSVGAWAVMGAYDFSRTFDGSGTSRAATLSGTYRVGPVVLKAGFSRQHLDADSNDFVSLGADYSLSRRTTLYASLGHRRDARQPARTALGLGISHAF